MGPTASALLTARDPQITFVPEQGVGRVSLRRMLFGVLKSLLHPL